MSEETHKHPFVLVSRQQLVFETSNGVLGVDDLWSLGLNKLDTMAVAIYATLKGSSESFLTNPDTKVTKETEEHKLRLEILKIVIDVKETENREKREAAANARQKEFLQGLLKKKELDELENLSTEEIKKQLEELG